MLALVPAAGCGDLGQGLRAAGIRRAPSTTTPGSAPDSLMLMACGRRHFAASSRSRGTRPCRDPRSRTQKINAAYALRRRPGLTIRTVEDVHRTSRSAVVIIRSHGVSLTSSMRSAGSRSMSRSLSAATSPEAPRTAASRSVFPRESTPSAARKPSPTPGSASQEPVSRQGQERVPDWLRRSKPRRRAAADHLDGVKDRLTDPLRLPYNYIKGPIIGWTAPKAFVTDMGALTLPSSCSPPCSPAPGPPMSFAAQIRCRAASDPEVQSSSPSQNANGQRTSC